MKIWVMPCALGEIHDGFDRVFTFENVNLSVRLSGELEIPIERLLIGGAQLRLPHIDNVAIRHETCSHSVGRS